MPERIQRKRTKGWRMPEGAIYVGRPTIWGNPFQVGGRTYRWRLGCWHQVTIDNPQHAVDLFREHITARGPSPFGGERPTPYAIEHELGGRDLACWCPLDQPCHADVLLELAKPGDTVITGIPISVNDTLPTYPSHREDARRIVRHGLADVLEWLGEPLGPAPGQPTHILIGCDPAQGSPGGMIAFVSREEYARIKADLDAPRYELVDGPLPGWLFTPNTADNRYV